MTKGAAMQSFFEGFGIPAYPSTSVPEEAEFPYLTYNNVQDNWGNQVALTVNLWYQTTSEKTPNDKVDEIAAALPRYVPCDGGAVLFSRGTPFSQALTDSTDKTVKRRYINITAEYLTLN